MARNVGRNRLAAAAVSGTAARVVQMRRLTPDEGLAEIARILSEAGIRPGSEQAKTVLNYAAVMYRSSRPGVPEWYEPALEFLVLAGADPQP